MAESVPTMRWADRAECAKPHRDPNWWITSDQEKGRPTSREAFIKRQAIAICKEECPVREDCLEYAIEENIKTDIWGGMTHLNRARHRRRLRGTNNR